MAILEEFKNAKKEQTILLKYTKTIDKEDIESDPVWRFMADEYKSCIKSKVSWEIRAACSVLNSILRQRRVIFAITRESTRELLKSDKNWPKGIGLKQDNYRKLLAFLFKNNIIDQVHYGKSSRKVMVCRLIHPEFLKLLTVDAEEQRIEAINFANKFSSKKPNIMDKYKTAIARI